MMLLNYNSWPTWHAAVATPNKSVNIYVNIIYVTNCYKRKRKVRGALGPPSFVDQRAMHTRPGDES